MAAEEGHMDSMEFEEQETCYVLSRIFHSGLLMSISEVFAR